MRNTTVQVMSTGQKVFRDKKGNFVSIKKVKRQNTPIRRGSLYDYRGTTVRAREEYEKGQRLVSVHDELFGLVKEKNLVPINKRRVNRYINNSPNV